jgi:hypothetical protein
MKRVGLCILLLVAVHSFSFADVTKLPIDTQRLLQEASRFRAANVLPGGIITLCADHNGRLADPDGMWEATDVISDTTLPTKRLIWAVTDGYYYVVHYESGGRAHGYHVLVARLEDFKAQFVWHGVGNKLKDYAAFLNALRSGELDDRRDYYH